MSHTLVVSSRICIPIRAYKIQQSLTQALEKKIVDEGQVQTGIFLYRVVVQILHVSQFI